MIIQKPLGHEKNISHMLKIFTKINIFFANFIYSHMARWQMNNAGLLTSYYSDHDQSIIIKADAINPNYIAHSCTDNYNDLFPLFFRLGNDRFRISEKVFLYCS